MAVSLAVWLLLLVASLAATVFSCGNKKTNPTEGISSFSEKCAEKEGPTPAGMALSTAAASTTPGDGP